MSAYVVAEAGSNHNGRFDLALRLIDVAAEARADAVKFQLFRADRLYSPKAGGAAYLGVDTSVYELLRALELPPEWLPRLREQCDRRGIDLLVSAFDEASVDLADPFVDRHKCASYELTHHPLLRHMAGKGKQLILSTGAATMDEVAAAVRAIEAVGHRDLVLLQCTARYPTALADANVGAMVALARQFGYPVGLSDHTREPTTAPSVAAALGAAVIEKHFTLDRRLAGPDHQFAIEPDELADLVQAVRSAECALGRADKRVLEVEWELREFARRSVFTRCSVRAGERFSRENLCVVRSGRDRAGLPPDRFESLLGKRARRWLDAHVGLREEDVAEDVLAEEVCNG